MKIIQIKKTSTPTKMVANISTIRVLEGIFNIRFLVIV